MAEVLVVFDEAIRADAGFFDARACGGIAEDDLWEGWVEFRRTGAGGEGDAEWIRSGRETEQPNVADLRYWAAGLSVVYLEGALKRALSGDTIPITHTDTLAATREHLAEKISAQNNPPGSGA